MASLIKKLGVVATISTITLLATCGKVEGSKQLPNKDLGEFTRYYLGVEQFKKNLMDNEKFIPAIRNLTEPLNPPLYTIKIQRKPNKRYNLKIYRIKKR